MENYYANEQQVIFEDLVAGGGGGGAREMENFYTNQAYLAAINGCLSLESFYNTAPASNSNCFDNFNSQLNLNAHGFAFADEQSPPDFPVDSSSSINFDARYASQDPDSRFFLAADNGPGLEIGGPCKIEPALEMPGAYNLGFGPQPTADRKSKAKKASGQPSKNLMAERRRRKRLNDRLSMLRSVVPKISKMDRTSILGDTIDYMKELIERINGLQKEMNLGSNQLSSMSIFNDVKPNEIVVRNSPKFDVERRNADTRIEICCGGKSGLLLSTVTTLEALGLEIKQCVISSFNEFSLQASCSEEMKQRAVLDSEDVRQALLRNAGYGDKS